MSSIAIFSLLGGLDKRKQNPR